MSVRYLYNTGGDYVAFQSGSYVFSPDADWIGFVKNGNEYYSSEGTFIGYVLNDDRVAKRTTDFPKLPVFRPFTPVRPFKPLKPLKRLRMPRLPHPYVDVFEHGVAGATAHTISGGSSLESLDGAQLFAADNTYLGKVTRNRFDGESLLNEFGAYGNQFNPNTLFNQFGPYGNPFSQLSPFNEYTRTPPRLVKGTVVLGYLTANQFVSPRIDPGAFFTWLGRHP